jgi:hypothetical protein
VKRSRRSPQLAQISIRASRFAARLVFDNGRSYEVAQRGFSRRRTGQGLAGGRGHFGAKADNSPSNGAIDMIKEHDCVVLTTDIPGEELETGDAGTVVHIHGDGSAYEVEFMTLAGTTVTVAMILPFQLRPVTKLDLTHVPELVVR